MKAMLFLAAAMLFFSTGFSHAADPDPRGTVRSIELPVINTELKAGEGREKVETHCAVCHSLDYITMQPKFSRTQWTSTVTKMIRVMGAPVPEDEAKIIIDYLSVHYGSTTP